MIHNVQNLFIPSYEYVGPHDIVIRNLIQIHSVQFLTRSAGVDKKDVE